MIHESFHVLNVATSEHRALDLQFSDREKDRVAVELEKVPSIFPNNWNFIILKNRGNLLTILERRAEPLRQIW